MIFTIDGRLSAQHVGRTIFGRAGRRRRRLSRSGRGDAAGAGDRGRHPGQECEPRPRPPGFGMINYDRGLRLGRRDPCRAVAMTEPIKPPRRKNPLLRTRLPTSPPRPRSRTSHGFTRRRRRRPLHAAALRRLRRRSAYPPREACPSCLSARPCIRRCAAPGHAARRDDRARAERRLFPRTRAVAASASSRLDCGPDDRDASPCRLRGGRSRAACRFNSTRAARRWPLPIPRGTLPTWQTTSSGGK